MINDKMPEYTIERASDILNRDKKPLNGSKILVLGVAYKNDIDDYRESPALKVIDLLTQKGADVSFYDPYISKYKYNGQWSKPGLSELREQDIQTADLVIITCGHTNVDYEMVSRSAASIFDTKNVMAQVAKRDNLEVL